MGELVVPYQSLSQEALAGIIEEYVTREGTDYGDEIVSLVDKCEQVLGQIKTGKALITFDSELGTCSIQVNQAK